MGGVVMARRNIRVKPGRVQSTVGFVGGLIFVCIGLFVVIPTFGPFGILWTLIAVAITVINGVNAFGKKGIPTMEIYTEDSMEETHTAHDAPLAAANTLDAKGRLEQLKSLKEAGLLTQEEYDRKRQEILRQL